MERHKNVFMWLEISDLTLTQDTEWMINLETASDKTLSNIQSHIILQEKYIFFIILGNFQICSKQKH